jgi:hypothetical protein
MFRFVFIVLIHNVTLVHNYDVARAILVSSNCGSRRREALSNGIAKFAARLFEPPQGPNSKQSPRPSRTC